MLNNVIMHTKYLTVFYKWNSFLSCNHCRRDMKEDKYEIVTTWFIFGNVTLILLTAREWPLRSQMGVWGFLMSHPLIAPSTAPVNSRFYKINGHIYMYFDKSWNKICNKHLGLYMYRYGRNNDWPCRQIETQNWVH